MKSTEFVFEATIPKVGMTLYHGTDRKNIVGILKYGLLPRYNRWETKYGGDKKDSIKGIFVTPDLEDAKNFADSGTHAYSVGVVLAFTLDASDQVEGEKFFDNELIIKNSIDPDRLQIVWPESMAKSFDKKKLQAQASFDKTAIIKEINKLTRPLGIFCRSASKTTARIITYFHDDKYYDVSILLKDYPAYLIEKGVDVATVQQVSEIIGK